jgi:hypothetical protein
VVTNETLTNEDFLDSARKDLAELFLTDEMIEDARLHSQPLAGVVYFSDLHSLDPHLTPQRRLESVYVGAVVYGLDEFARESLGRLFALANGTEARTALRSHLNDRLDEIIAKESQEIAVDTELHFIRLSNARIELGRQAMLGLGGNGEIPVADFA